MKIGLHSIGILALGLCFACGGPEKKQAPASEAPVASTEETTTAFFEMRTYYCHPGKLDDLLTRFEDHTMALFEKHGMVNLGYWVPVEGDGNTLVYLLGYPDKASRDASWEAFMNDPVWQSVWADSKKDGPVVDSLENRFLSYTDYSPKWQTGDFGPRLFSLRTYYTHPGKLEALHARFRDHTLDIFENNGMTNVGYFNLDPSEAGADATLMYFITFPDTAARRSSWEAFGQDPAWKQAYEASTREGPLVDSITAQLLVATDFSPLK